MPPSAQLRIALIHALAESIEPTTAAFRKHWPSAQTFNLLDDSLAVDRGTEPESTDDIHRRVRALAGYALNAATSEVKTAAILFTCSAFGESIAMARRDIPIPVLTPNEAAFDAAMDHGKNIAIVVTFAPSAGTLRDELETMAASRNINVTVSTHLVEGALDALQNGRTADHDSLIAQKVQRLGGKDVILLGQFSMARAAGKIVTPSHQKLLTTPDLAVQRLRDLVEG